MDDGNWLYPDRLLACAFPWGPDGLAALAERGISVVVNLHERGHDPERLARLGLTEIHLPGPGLHRAHGGSARAWRPRDQPGAGRPNSASPSTARPASDGRGRCWRATSSRRASSRRRHRADPRRAARLDRDGRAAGGHRGVRETGGEGRVVRAVQDHSMTEPTAASSWGRGSASGARPMMRISDRTAG